MSSALDSPRPETPVKSKMVAENETKPSMTPSHPQRPQVFTPRPNGMSKGKEQEMPLHMSDPKIQVPSSIPPPVNPLEEDENNEGEDDHGLEKDQDQHQHLNSDETEAVDDPQAELPSFDWDDFQHRYNDALTSISQEEDELLKDFEKLFNKFGVWAQAGSEKDDNRCNKRLRTEERYVQMAEETLREKKEHYESVVNAFQAAIDMLRRSTSRK